MSGIAPPGPAPRTPAPAVMQVPRIFQLGVLLFLLATGAFPLVIQAMWNGVTDGTGFAAAVVTGLVYDLLRVAPLVVLARHPSGILHPIIVAVVVWPLLTTLPNLIDNYGGYAGLLSGVPVSAPYYKALAWQEPRSVWLALTKFKLLQSLALISLYGGFAFVRRHSGRPVRFLSGAIDTLRVRRILIGVIIVNFLAVALFIELRGGLVEHVIQLAFGRYRALAGLGPLLVLFDIAFVAILLWICLRPDDARRPIFIVLLPLVAAQQFVVAGARSSTLLVFVLVGLGWALASRRVPWRLAIILVPIAFLSFGALNLIRTAGLTGTTAIEAAQDASFESVVARSQQEFDLRQSLIGSVPVVADAMRTTGPMYGYTYSGALFAMVPRALWPDKPRGPGSLYAQHFLGESVEGTAVPIGAVAEAFWNFHIPGVVILFAFYGWALRRGLETYNRNPRNGAVVAAFVLLATQFGVGTDELVAFQQLMLTSLLLCGIILLFYPGAIPFRQRSGPARGKRPPDRISI